MPWLMAEGTRVGWQRNEHALASKDCRRAMSDRKGGVSPCGIVYTCISQGIAESSLMLNANRMNGGERQMWRTRSAGQVGLILPARGVSSVFVYTSSQVTIGRFDIPSVGL